MEMDYDSEADALSITIKKGVVDRTIELAPEVNLDVDKKGRPLYLEIVAFSERIGKKKATKILQDSLTLA